MTPPVPPATAWTNTILYNFQGGADGSGPNGSLVFRNGALFGVTQDLGDTGRGTAFRLSPPVPPATAWTKTIIHRFAGVSSGTWPLPSNLIFDTAGALYGATQRGGTSGNGTVFKLTPSPVWTEWTHATLYSFGGFPDGQFPSSGLVFDSAGALYGVTAWGGNSGSGFGAVYRLTPPVPPATTWTESVVYSFKGAPDGMNPNSSLIFDTSGGIYGTTNSGGLEAKGAAFRLGR